MSILITPKIGASAKRASDLSALARRRFSRDKTNLDISWLKDDSLRGLEELPAPEVILDEIMENLQSALGELEQVKKRGAGLADLEF